METRDVAYAIATALQKKFTDGMLTVHICAIGVNGVLLYEFRYRKGALVVGTAYTESYFELNESKQASWVAKRILEELRQRMEWATMRAKK